MNKQARWKSKHALCIKIKFKSNNTRMLDVRTMVSSGYVDTNWKEYKESF